MTPAVSEGNVLDRDWLTVKGSMIENFECASDVL